MFKKLVAVLLLAAAPAAFGTVIVHNTPWGYNPNAQMNTVFGGGNYTQFTYAGANAGAIFNARESFVYLEGGDGTEGAFTSFLNANAATVLNWVNAGGRLLVQSAGWFRGAVNLGPGTIAAGQTNLSPCGTLTAAGIAAFNFGGGTAAAQCGNFLSHNDILGVGLTTFMTANTGGGAIVAGAQYGAGFIMYSGLTTANWHNNGPSLQNNVIACTAGLTTGCAVAAVPEPLSLFLVGFGLLGVAATRRKFGKKA